MRQPAPSTQGTVLGQDALYTSVQGHALMRDLEHELHLSVAVAADRQMIACLEKPLGSWLTTGKATVAECEEELKMNRRTLQRDLKLLVEKGLVREIGRASCRER